MRCRTVRGSRSNPSLPPSGPSLCTLLMMPMRKPDLLDTLLKLASLNRAIAASAISGCRPAQAMLQADAAAGAQRVVMRCLTVAEVGMCQVCPARTQVNAV